MHINEIYQVYLRYPKITTDTRKIEADSIFLALKGESFNGNSFADQALLLGARYVIIDEPAYKKDERYILVNNVLTTLQELATHHRNQLKIPIIGITGTNGKTTTKELIYSVLKQRFKTFATLGNLNNHIGVPLSILSIDPNIEIAIIEMGANHQGEIAFLSTISKPNYGLITNVGRAHLEGFGSYEGVKKTKAELYNWLANHDGVLFLQSDNPELVKMANNFNFKEVIKYGYHSTNDIFGELLANDPLLRLKWDYKSKSSSAKTQLTGAYNVENILAAISIGCYFGLSEEEINKGLADYKPQNNRSQVLKTENNTIICDFYNANASSMKAALENIQNIQTDLNKTVILGDMFELGDESASEHRKLIEQTRILKDIDCIFIGKEFYQQKDSHALFFETTEEAVDSLKNMYLKDKLILLKASRGMAFEKILNVL